MRAREMFRGAKRFDKREDAYAYASSLLESEYEEGNPVEYGICDILINRVFNPVHLDEHTLQQARIESENSEPPTKSFNTASNSHSAFVLARIQ